MPEVIDSSALQKEATDLAYQNVRLHEQLRASWHQSEDQCRSQWSRLTLEKKRRMVKEAFGEDKIPKHHRPDCARLRRTHEIITRDARDTPYVNIEDLCDNGLLIMMLHVRSENHPSLFAASEIRQAHQLSGGHQCMLIDGHEHVMLVANSASYGNIVPVSSEHSTEGVSPYLGLWLLRLQERVLSGLVKCSTSFLRRAESKDSHGAVQPDFMSSPIAADDWRSLAAFNLEAAYQLAGNINFDVSRTLCDDAIANIVYELQDVTADPETFIRHAEMISESRIYGNYGLEKQATLIGKANTKSHVHSFTSRSRLLEHMRSATTVAGLLSGLNMLLLMYTHARTSLDKFRLATPLMYRRLTTRSCR